MKWERENETRSDLNNWRPEDGQPLTELLMTDSRAFLGPTCPNLEPIYALVMQELSEGSLVRSGDDVIEYKDGNPTVVLRRLTGQITGLAAWHEKTIENTSLRGNILAKNPLQTAHYETAWGATNAIVKGPSGILYAGYYRDGRSPSVKVRRPLCGDFDELMAWLHGQLK
jgi:hypothetical protein